MNGTSIFGCLFASVSACVTGKFYQMGRSNVRRRHRNLLDYPDSHNLWNTQILTRIWPFLTRLPDDSLLLLQPDRAFTNIISYLQVQLLFVFPRVSFRVWAFLYSAKLMWLKFLHLLKKKIWKSILHKSLIQSKIRRFFLLSISGLDDFLTFSSLTLIKLEKQPLNRFDVQLSQEIQV